MTQPVLSFGVRARGRHYPYPPTDPSGWPRNQWGSVNPQAIPPEVEAWPSVTNILSVSAKDALKYWAAEQAIRELYQSGVIPLDVERAVWDHKFACNRVSEARAEAGTRAHTIAERLTSDLPLPASLSGEDEAYADAFMAWWTDHTPEPLEVEATVYGDGYAGTADLVASVQEAFGRQVMVVDYKTRGERDEKKLARYGAVYDETRMQLAALAACQHVASEGSDGWELLPLPKVEAAMGVVLFPDGSYATEVLDQSELDRWYGGFMGFLGAWRALKEVV